MPVTPANASVEGRTTVEVELQLPNNRFIPITSISVIHVLSQITESVNSISSHEMWLRAPTTDFVDNIIRGLQSLGTPLIRYRVGVGIPGNISFLPWQNQIVSDFSAVLEGSGPAAGHFVRLALRGTLFTMSRSTHTATRRGLVSDIVEQIATQNGFTSSVIEKTVGQGLWVQSFVDDEDFIRSRLVRRAINAAGRGCYNFFVQDNVLHFHSPDYQTQLKQLVFYSANNLGLTQIDESQHMLEYGASSVRVVAYDPYTASMTELVSDPTKALKLGNVITPLTRVPGGDLNYPFHISTNTAQEAQNIAQALYENARIQMLGLKLVIARSIFLRIGDLLQLTVAPAANKNSPWAGVYYVTRASYEIKNGSLVSSFVVQRGEFQTSAQTQSTILINGAPLVVSEQDAPGQPLNVKSADSSSLTHGAGKSASTSIYVDTQNANTAPNPSPLY